MRNSTCWRKIFVLALVALILSLAPTPLFARNLVWLRLDQLDNLVGYVYDDDVFDVDPVLGRVQLDTRHLQFDYTEPGTGPNLYFDLVTMVGRDPLQAHITDTTALTTYADVSTLKNYWFKSDNSAGWQYLELGIGNEIYQGSFQDNNVSIQRLNAFTLTGQLTFKRTLRGESIALDSPELRFTADSTHFAFGKLLQLDSLRGGLQVALDSLPQQRLTYSFSRTATSRSEVVTGAIRDLLHNITYSGTWIDSNGRGMLSVFGGNANMTLTSSAGYFTFNSRLANKRRYAASYREGVSVTALSTTWDRNLLSASISDGLWSGSLHNTKTRERMSFQALRDASNDWQWYFLNNDYRLDSKIERDDFALSGRDLHTGETGEITSTYNKVTDERQYHASVGGWTVDGLQRTGERSFSWTRPGLTGTGSAVFLRSGDGRRTATVEEDNLSFVGELSADSRDGSAILTTDDLVASAKFSRAQKYWLGDIEALYKGTDKYHLSIERSGHDARFFWEDGNDHVLLTRVGGIKTLEFTRAGQLYTWNNATIDKILHGDVDELITRVHDDMGRSLDFDYRWGAGDSNSISFDEATRTLSMEIDGHSASIRRTSAELGVSYHSPDGRIGLVGEADNQSTGIHFSEARYADEFLTLDLAGVTLERFNKLDKTVGLYFGDKYLLKVHSADKEELSPLVNDAWDKALSGDLGTPERDNLIRTAVKQVDVNARELAKNHVTFQDQRWNDLLTSLAWDVGEFSLSADQIIQVVDAKEHNQQLYNILDGMLPGTVGASLLNAERQVALDLGQSLLDQNKPSDSLAVMGFSSGSRVSYDNMAGGNFLSQHGSLGEVNRGYLDVQVPAFGAGSRTMLGFSAPADRFMCRWDDESSGSGSLSFSSTALFYAYHFSEDMSFRLSDGHEQRFSIFKSAANPFTYALDDQKDAGVFLPGALWRTHVATPNEFWYASLTAVPYVPLALSKDMNFYFGPKEDSSTYGKLTSLNMATDIRTGFNTQLAGHRSKLEVGKTVNGGFMLAPEVDVIKDRLTLGMDAETRSGGGPSLFNYRADVTTLDVKTRLFLEDNLFFGTRMVGTSLEKKVGDNTYALSYGMSTWNNVGSWESVETYYAVGFSFRNRVQLMQAVTFNDIDLSTSFRNSAQVTFFKERNLAVGWDTTLRNTTDGLDVGVCLRTTLQF